MQPACACMHVFRGCPHWEPHSDLTYSWRYTARWIIIDQQPQYLRNKIWSDTWGLYKCSGSVWPTMNIHVVENVALVPRWYDRGLYRCMGRPCHTGSCVFTQLEIACRQCASPGTHNLASRCNKTKLFHWFLVVSSIDVGSLRLRWCYYNTWPHSVYLAGGDFLWAKTHRLHFSTPCCRCLTHLAYTQWYCV